MGAGVTLVFALFVIFFVPAVRKAQV
jgi:hypothetical protein